MCAPIVRCAVFCAVIVAPSNTAGPVRTCASLGNPGQPWAGEGDYSYLNAIYTLNKGVGHNLIS